MKIGLPSFLSKGDYQCVRNMSSDKADMPSSLARYRPHMQVLAEQLVASNPSLVILWVNIVPRLLRLYALQTDQRINATTRLLFCQALLDEPTIDLRDVLKC